MAEPESGRVLVTYLTHFQSKYFLALGKAALPNFLLFVNTLTPMFSFDRIMSQVHSLARDRAGCPGSNCTLMPLTPGPHLTSPYYYCFPVCFFCPNHVACGVREESLEYPWEAWSAVNLSGLCVQPYWSELFCIRKDMCDTCTDSSVPQFPLDALISLTNGRKMT